MQIVVDSLDGPDIAALLREHLDDMHRISPPASVHAFDLSRLRAPDVTFWSAWRERELLGCVALKEIDRGHGEIKSMRTTRLWRGRGVGAALLDRILAEAAQRGYTRLSLETGTQPEFGPARALYTRFGFTTCGPFGDYVEDPCSAFMTRTLPGPHSQKARKKPT